MKNKFNIFAILFCSCFILSPAYSYSSCTSPGSDCDGYGDYRNSSSGCMYTGNCHQYDCDDGCWCISDDDASMAASCTASCTDDCSSVGNWGANGTGKEKRVLQIWDQSQCKCYGDEEYRCAAGYYGNGSTCTKCPCMTDAGGTERCGTNSAGSNSSITSCNMGTSYSFNDGPGNYNFTSNCAYTS